MNTDGKVTAIEGKRANESKYNRLSTPNDPDLEPDHDHGGSSSNGGGHEVRLRKGEEVATTAQNASQTQRAYNSAEAREYTDNPTPSAPP